MSIDTLSAAIVGHVAGDYLLQNDWMASGKKRSSLICAAHVAVYTACVVLFAGWFDWWLVAAVAVPHFLIDRWTFVAWWMRTIRQPVFMEPPMSPWSRIAVDNSMHMVCLYAVALLNGGP